MKITPDQIPDEVFLKMRELLLDGFKNEKHILASALAAWPGAFFSGSTIQADRITLPLPQEKRA